MPRERRRKILEIGSGWGFASSFMANESGGDEVLGITLSAEQLRWSQEQWGRYSENLEFRYLDYRSSYDVDHEGFFDGILSIGMLEHVHLKVARGGMRALSLFPECARNQNGALSLHSDSMSF